MKAYQVSSTDDDIEYMDIVFANTQNEARKKAMDSEALEQPNYIETRAKRVSWADGMEGCSELEIVIAELKHGWYFELDSENYSSRIYEEDIPQIRAAGYKNLGQIAKDFAKGKFKSVNYEED